MDAFAITSTYAGTNDRLLYGLRDPYSGIITRTLGAIQFRTRLQLYYSPHHFRIGWNNDWLDKEYYDALQVTYEADMKQVRSYQTDPVVHSWAGGTFSYVSSYSQGDPKEVYTPSPSGKDFYVDMQSVTIRDPDWGVFYAGGHIRSLTIRCNSSSCYFI